MDAADVLAMRRYEEHQAAKIYCHHPAAIPEMDKQRDACGEEPKEEKWIKKCHSFVVRKAFGQRHSVDNVFLPEPSLTLSMTTFLRLSFFVVREAFGSFVVRKAFGQRHSVNNVFLPEPSLTLSMTTFLRLSFFVARKGASGGWTNPSLQLLFNHDNF